MTDGDNGVPSTSPSTKVERTMMTPNKRPKGAGSVYQRKADGLWCASLEIPTEDGTRKRKVLVRKSEAAAKKALRELILTIEKTGKVPEKTQPLNEWLDYWFNRIAVKELAPKTANNYRGMIRNHISPAIGGVRLDKITNDHIRRVHDRMLESGKSSTTTLYAHNVLSAALDAAKNEGIIATNPATRVKRPRKEHVSIPVLTAEDGKKILATVAHDRLGSLWAIALYTGMREGELIGLTIDRVTDIIDLSWQLQRFTWEHGCDPKCGEKLGANCPKKKVTLPADSESYQLHGGLWMSRPKSRAGERRIELAGIPRQILEHRIAIAKTEPNPYNLVWTAEFKDKHGRDLPLDGSPIDPARASKMWHEVLVRAGIGKTRLHATRHTAASLLMARNTSETIIQKILGHNSFVASQIYIDVDRSQKRAAMESISDQLQIES